MGSIALGDTETFKLVKYFELEIIWILTLSIVKLYKAKDS